MKNNIYERFGKIEIQRSICNISTVQDGRGGIFTWELPDRIVEVNFIYYHPNKIRGNHFHPEFNEYWFLVEGSGIKVTPDPKNKKKQLIRHVSEGTMMRIPKNTTHAFHAITQAKAVSMLTKYWKDCKRPIVHEKLVEMDQDYKEYAKKLGFKNSAEELVKK